MAETVYTLDHAAYLFTTSRTNGTFAVSNFTDENDELHWVVSAYRGGSSTRSCEARGSYIVGAYRTTGDYVYFINSVSVYVLRDDADLTASSNADCDDIVQHTVGDNKAWLIYAMPVRDHTLYLLLYTASSVIVRRMDMSDGGVEDFHTIDGFSDYTRAIGTTVGCEATASDPSDCYVVVMANTRDIVVLDARDGQALEGPSQTAPDRYMDEASLNIAGEGINSAVALCMDSSSVFAVREVRIDASDGSYAVNDLLRMEIDYRSDAANLVPRRIDGFDYDGDGDLDLAVAYVNLTTTDMNAEMNSFPTSDQSQNRVDIYRNRGDGTFESSPSSALYASLLELEAGWNRTDAKNNLMLLQYEQPQITVLEKASI